MPKVTFFEIKVKVFELYFKSRNDLKRERYGEKYCAGKNIKGDQKSKELKVQHYRDKLRQDEKYLRQKLVSG